MNFYRYYRHARISSSKYPPYIESDVLKIGFNCINYLNEYGKKLLNYLVPGYKIHLLFMAKWLWRQRSSSFTYRFSSFTALQSAKKERSWENLCHHASMRRNINCILYTEAQQFLALSLFSQFVSCSLESRAKGSKQKVASSLNFIITIRLIWLKKSFF